jgi:hypothetical protein
VRTRVVCNCRFRFASQHYDNTFVMTEQSERLRYWSMNVCNEKSSSLEDSVEMNDLPNKSSIIVPGNFEFVSII